MLSERHFIEEPVVFPKHTWEGLTTRFPRLPAFHSLPCVRRSHLGRTWLGGVPHDRNLRISDLDQLRAYVQSDCLASDPMQWKEAADTVLTMVDWLQANPTAPVRGRIVSRSDFPGRINTLYFDGPPFREWEAFAVWTRTFVLDEEWVFVVEP